MIKIRIRNADHEIDIRFPITRSELFAKLGEIHAVEGRDAAQSALVTEVYWPEEFSMLKDHFANLGELNYEDREKFLPFCVWYDEEPIMLVTEKEDEPK